MRCEDLLDALHEARTTHEFDLSNQVYKKYLELIQRVIDSRCHTDTTDLRKYYGDIDYVNSGK